MIAYVPYLTKGGVEHVLHAQRTRDLAILELGMAIGLLHGQGGDFDRAKIDRLDNKTGYTTTTFSIDPDP